MLNKVCNKIQSRKTSNDIIYTPKPVALDMINICKITADMKVLDPSRGGGIFYNNLPPCIKSYCEIQENKDFFEFKEKQDLIIGNPPYSLWDKWIDHTCTLTDKFCYIFGILNLRPNRIDYLQKKGYGITYLKIIQIDWWFGASFIVIFEKNKKSIIDYTRDRILCDICNKRCKRGLTKDGKKYGMNECSNN